MKKGFTLVELLAVIVILAVILIIAIPQVLKVVDNSRISTFEADAKMLLKAVELKMFQDPTFDITDINKNNINLLLNISDENYSSVFFTLDEEQKINVVIEGAGKWDNLVVSGSFKEMFVTNNIVRDGLVLQLDASNIDSYPRMGNVWYDLSGNNNNCNWNISPVYNAEGYFVFDGTSHFGTITNNPSLDFSSEQTLIMVLRHTFTSGRRNSWDQAYGGYGTWTHEQGSFFNSFFGDSGTNASPYIGVNSPSTPREVWNVIAITRDVHEHKWYFNGILRNTRDNPYGVLTHTPANIRIGRGYAGYWQGDMAYVLAYNRALSADEMMQNFNALRGRYGL